MRLDLYRVDIPFTTAFAHSSAVRTATQSVWVEARSGLDVGVGEGCPREYVTGESLESAHAFFDTNRQGLEKAVNSVDTLVAWVGTHSALIDANPAAWCAVELALLELFARREDIPVEQLVEVPPTTGNFRYSAVVGDGGTDAFRATVARYREIGFVDFKLKLSGDPTRDRTKIGSFRDLKDMARFVFVSTPTTCGTTQTWRRGTSKALIAPSSASRSRFQRTTSKVCDACLSAPVLRSSWTKASFGQRNWRRSPEAPNTGSSTYAFLKWGVSCVRWRSSRTHATRALRSSSALRSARRAFSLVPDSSSLAQRAATSSRRKGRSAPTYSKRTWQLPR